MMKIKNIIGTTALAALLFSCAQEEITPETPTAPGDGKVTLRIQGVMPSSNNPDSRAYMGSDRGVYWMDGDKISVLPESLYEWGVDYFPFITGKEADGKQRADFTCTGDWIDMVPTFFTKGSKFVACYPTLGTSASRGTEKNKELRKRCILQNVSYQNGETSRHLKNDMFMFTGEMELTENLKEEGGQYMLPPITFKHKTAVHRFYITNRQPYPIDIESVKMTAIKAGTESEYPIFYKMMDVNLKTMESTPFNDGSAPNHAAHEIKLSQDGKQYFTLQPGKSFYAYVISFPVVLNNANLRFSITGTDGTVYNTLALPGSKIQDGRFEEGKCYTYDLLVDQNLTLQGWEVDYIDNVNFGQQSFTLSTDKVVLPLDGSRRETITLKTSDASGWSIKDMPDWVSASITSGGTGESQITFSAQPTSSDREGEVCITSGNLNKYLKIVQSASYGKTDAIYLTKADMKNEEITSYILQDDEPGEILYDKSQRSFNTTQPLQFNLTNDNKLHLRFYSPRKLTDVQVWASIPSIMEEEFLLAELEELAPFADVNATLPAFGEKDLRFRTLSGKEITFKKGPTFPIKNLKLKITSSCPYWKMLQNIKVNWNVSFRDYTQHQYTKPGYVMRGAHCREAVALSLNNTYMFSTDEYRDFMFGLQGKLYSDNEGMKFVDTKDMYYNKVRKERPMSFGLTTTAGFAGLGRGDVFYILESAYLTSYADDIADPDRDVFWHEFGHVLGYGHDGNIVFPKHDIGWAALTIKMYLKMSKEKKLPVYSRRFLHTRDTPGTSLYESDNKRKVEENHSFGTTPEDDAELYEIDGGKLWYFNNLRT